MLKINRKVEYALIALKFISDQKNREKLISAREICDQFDIPFDTTAKVMQVMNNKKILASVKGVHGGYLLEKNLNDITYYELSQIIEGDQGVFNCVKDGQRCNRYEDCNIVKPLDLLNMKISNYLKTLTLSDLFVQNILDISKTGEQYDK